MNVSKLLNAPFEWAKRQVTRTQAVGRSRLLEEIVKRDPTEGYHPQRFFQAELLVNDLPLYTLWSGRLMLSSDPIVQFAMNVRDAALTVAEVEIKAKDERLQKWLEKQWHTIWEMEGNKVRAAKRWGYAGLQPVYCEDKSTGLIDIERLKDFAPEDVRPLESEGSLCGFRVKNAKLFGPEALWLTFGQEYGNHYGRGCLRRMYPPWYTKWMDRGAERLTQLRMIKDAYIGDIFWYPENMLAELPDGKQISFRDLFRQLSENRMSGGALTLPKIFDAEGHELTGYTPPHSIAGATDIFQWRDSVNEGILQGADVPVEVVKASETGSGFSGRSIPFMVLLSVCNSEFIEYVVPIEALLREVAWLNFGGDPDFELRPKSLVESFAKDASGSPMGGGAIGGQPGQVQGVSAQPGGMNQPQPARPMPTGGQVARFDESHSYSSTQFNLPGELAFQVVCMSGRIDHNDLAGDGRELNPHITVKYGLHTNDPEEVRKVVQDSAPVAVTFGKTSVFPALEASSQRGGEQYDVIKIEIESQGLRDLNAAISEKLHCTDTHPEYKPHCTIAYVKPGLGEKYAETLNDLQGKVAVFDRLIFSDKSRTHTSILLTGKSTRFEEPTPPSRDEIAELGSRAARERIRAAAAAVRAASSAAQKKTTELADSPLLANDPAALDLLTDIEALITELSRDIFSDLQASMLAGQLAGAAEVVVSVPPALTPPAAPVGPPRIPPTPPTLAALFPDEPPRVTFPVIDDALEVLTQAEVFTDNDYRVVAEQVKQGAFGITSDLEAKAVADVRDILAENIAKGANLEDFTNAVVARLENEGPLSESHIETIFRTNVNAAFSNGANKSLEQPMVTDAFPYRAYFATTDQRVRHEHIALEKLGLNGTNIYRADDPTWQKFRPPWDYNCRCSWTPVSVEQAARRGVSEAQEWWERARAMRDEQFNGEGRIVEYLNRTAPSEREWVTPPEFQPSPEFSRNV